MSLTRCIALILLLTSMSAGARVLRVPADALSRPQTTPFALMQAQDARDQRPPGPATLEEAIEIAVQRYGGRAADADTVVRDGRRVHEIRVLGEDGSVRTVRVDPETGAIIPQRRSPD